MQAEFLKNVRETVTNAQAKATARLEGIEGDAKKAIAELVEKGKTSQKDIADRIAKVKPAAEELVGKVASPDVRAKVEELGKKAKDAQAKAFTYVDATSREQAGVFAVELRKLADRLDKLAKKDEPAAANVH